MRQRVNKLKDGTAEEVERLMYLKMELEKINQDVRKDRSIYCIMGDTALSSLP